MGGMPFAFAADVAVTLLSIARMVEESSSTNLNERRKKFDLFDFSSSFHGYFTIIPYTITTLICNCDEVVL